MASCPYKDATMPHTRTPTQARWYESFKMPVEREEDRELRDDSNRAVVPLNSSVTTKRSRVGHKSVTKLLLLRASPRGDGARDARGRRATRESVSRAVEPLRETAVESRGALTTFCTLDIGKHQYADAGVDRCNCRARTGQGARPEPPEGLPSAVASEISHATCHLSLSAAVTIRS